MISPYYHDMFKSGDKSFVQMNGIDDEALEAIVLFAYTDKLTVDVTTVEAGMSGRMCIFDPKSTAFSFKYLLK